MQSRPKFIHHSFDSSHSERVVEPHTSRVLSVCVTFVFKWTLVERSLDLCCEQHIGESWRRKRSCWAVGLMAAAARSLRQPKAHQRHASPVPADVPTSNHLHSPPLSGTFTTAAATINSQTLCFLLDVGCRRNYSLSFSVRHFLRIGNKKRAWMGAMRAESNY